VSTSLPASAGCEDALNQQASWLAALRMLREALELLDKSNAPPEVGAQLDRTIHYLQAAIHRSFQRSS
jgi:hypothetical protein